MTKHITDIFDSKGTKKALGYARVSTVKQKSEGNSIEFQRNAIKDYTTKNNLFLIDILDESKSASEIEICSSDELLTKRPILQDILDRAKKHEFTDLILNSRDRLSRNFYQTIILRSLFIRFNITIHYVSTSEKLSEDTTYIDKFTDLVFSNIAMLEAGLIGQRAKSGQKLNIQKGFYAGGHVPYGYNVEPDRVEKKKIFIKNTTQEIIINRIFALYNLRFSYLEISEIIKSEFPTENNKSFSKSTLSQIINNEMYTGILIWNRKFKHQLGENDTTVRSAQSDSIKIISPELFNKVHEIKCSKNGINNMCYRSNFVLKGKLICGNCNKPLKAKNNGKGKKNVYYCPCNNKISKNNKIKWSISIPQNEIEEYIFNYLNENLINSIRDSNLLRKYHLLYLSMLKDEKNKAGVLLDLIQDELNDIEESLSKANKTLENKSLLKKENKDLYSDNFFKEVINLI